MPIPSISELNETRLSKFKQSVMEATKDDSLEGLMPIVDMLIDENEASPEVLLAALIKLAQGDEPLLLKESDRPDLHAPRPRRDDDRRGGERDGRNRRDGREGRDSRRKSPRDSRRPEQGMQRYRIEVGHTHGVKPGNIVGAIANEAGIDSKYIGAIEIYDNFTTVDLPEGMPKEVKQTLQDTRVSGQRMGLREWSDKPPARKKGPKPRN